MVCSLTHQVQSGVVERMVAFACPQVAPQAQDGAGHEVDKMVVAAAFTWPRLAPQIQDTDQKKSSEGHVVEERVLALVPKAAPQKQAKGQEMHTINEYWTLWCRCVVIEGPFDAH
jgi:hypothetical protein